MPKYRVRITEVVFYEMEIEADSAEQAEADAEAVFVEAEDLSQFGVTVDERTCHAEECLS
jgi:hypothetical protein